MIFPHSLFMNHPFLATCHLASHCHHPTPIASYSDFLLPSHLLQTFPMDPLSEGHTLLETTTTPRQRGDEQGLGGFPLMKKLNERLRNFRIPLGWLAVYIFSVCHYHCKLISKMVIDALWRGLPSTNAPSTTDWVLGDLYYTPVGIVAVMVLLGLLHFFHVIG